MSRELANLIDALIPGAIGLAMVLLPNVFLKKDASQEKRGNVKKIGAVLIIISIVYLMLKKLSG